MFFSAYNELVTASALAEDQLPDLIAISCITEVCHNASENPLSIDG